MRSALGRKSVVVLLGVLGGILLLASSRTDWVTGHVADVAGPAATTATGSEAVPGLPGIALVAMAAVLAAVTSGRVGRVVAAVALLVGAAALVALPVRVLRDPAGVLGSVAGSRTGGTSSLEATGHATAWPWVSVGAAALLVLACLGVLLGRRTWRALGEDPGGSRSETDRSQGPAADRTSSDWDRLSDGDDPTTWDGDEDRDVAR